MGCGLKDTTKLGQFTQRGGVAPTLCAGMGEGGGVVPKIMEIEYDDRRSERDNKEHK